MGDTFYKVFRETLTEKVTFVHRPRLGIGKKWCRYLKEEHLGRENSKVQIPRGRIMSGMSKNVHRVHGRWKGKDRVVEAEGKDVRVQSGAQVGSKKQFKGFGFFQ